MHKFHATTVWNPLFWAIFAIYRMQLFCYNYKLLYNALIDGFFICLLFQWKARTASFDSQGSCPSPKPPASPWSEPYVKLQAWHPPFVTLMKTRLLLFPFPAVGCFRWFPNTDLRSWCLCPDVHHVQAVPVHTILSQFLGVLYKSLYLEYYSKPTLCS